MQIEFKYKGVNGFGRWYNYAYKHTRMITKEAEQRLKILQFWRKYGLTATTDAYGVKRSTLYYWWKIYKDNESRVESLNPGKQVRIHKNKRVVDERIVAEIKRLRLAVCPNMGKTKIKKELDTFCVRHHLSLISESKIGRIITDKKIYHHRQKVSHYGVIKIIKKGRKQENPKNLG